MKTIRIIIADDHVIVRAGLKQILSDYPNMAVVDDVDTGQELIEKVRHSVYDIVLLDISMPDRNGLEILKQLKIENPAVPILILSMHPEEQYATRAFKAGAAGYLTKRSAPTELVAAINKIVQGGKYVSNRYVETLVSLIGNDAEKLPHEDLTDREYQIFRMIALGKTVNEIAKELFLSVSTISTYRRRILDKMEMKNNIDMVKYAMSYKLLE
ncbi:MAG: response regulator transcription factor [bacterium]|nr:response regulator transcription factor [bacterium]